MSQPSVDATNFARLTTDVSIYFGSTSIHYNNTISCLLICDIIFQPYVFPIMALEPFSTFFITFALPAMGGTLLTNKPIAYPISTETRTQKHNTVNWREDNWDGLKSAVYEVLLSNANMNSYTIESQRDCMLLVWVLTVWCVQLGFGLWRAILHGTQRVGAGTTLLILFFCSFLKLRQ